MVVGLAGMPGAGKSVAVEVAKSMGYDVVAMGDVVREEAKKKNLKCTPKNLGKIMLELRAQEGKSVIARRCIPKIVESVKEKVIVDGVRNLSEVEEFKRVFPSFTLIAIKASPETRFKRLFHRKRGDDPKNWEIFQERDARELSVGLGEAIAKAEYSFENESTLTFAKKQTAQILRKIEEKWIK